MEPRWWVEFRSFRSSYLQPSKIYAGICTVPFHCFNLQQLQRVYFQNIFVFCFRRCYQVWLFFTFFLKFFIDTPVETSSYSFGRELNFHLCFNSTRLHFLSKCWNCSSKKSNSFCSESWSTLHVKNFTHYRVFSFTWPASMQIYWNKRERLHKKRVQLPEDWFGTPTWPPVHCFGTPIWPPWRHVKTL